MLLNAMLFMIYTQTTYLEPLYPMPCYLMNRSEYKQFGLNEQVP